MKVINSLKLGIPVIFERIGCNIEDSNNLSNNEINEGNILQYLGIIER